MAGRAGAPVRDLSYEVVRRVAALALDAGVELLVGRGVLVAGAAVPHAAAGGRARRVGVVATNASSDFALLGMVRVLVGVTARASLIGAALNVVSRVAAGALAMAGGVARAEHREIFVASPAGNRLLLAELMRLVAADASHVATFEERRRRHHGFGLLVTRSAGSERLRGCCVLLLMASRAHLIGRLTADGVRGLDVLMAVLARPRLRRRVLVWSVAVEALAAVVNLDGGREGLARAVAMSTIAGLVRVQLLVLREILERLHAGVVAKTMTHRAVTLELCL
jgi:hypothetical protein